MRTRKMKKVIVAILTAGMLAGMGVSAQAATIEVETGVSGDELEAFRAICQEFTDETGIDIDLVTPGTDYEPVLKTRMASNDLPDVFVTHGWSVLRYSEFLRPVNDQEWFANYKDAILPVITDDEGNAYVNCVSMSNSGYLANSTVLKEAGVDPFSIVTMDDFLDACAKVKEIGKTPIYVGGKNNWPMGNVFQFMACALYASEGAEHDAREAFLDGSFDWTEDGKPMFDMLADMLDKGYFNDDFMTEDEQTEFQKLAGDEAAFSFSASVLNVHSYNPDAEVVVLPKPCTGDAKPMVTVGEGNSFGVWKDSEFIEEGLQFLDYLARPEIAQRICEASSTVPCLTTTPIADTEANVAIANMIDSYDDLCYANVFDRAYMPSGMWTIMGDSLTIFFEDPVGQYDEAIEFLQDNFAEKYEAAHE